MCSGRGVALAVGSFEGSSIINRSGLATLSVDGALVKVINYERSSSRQALWPSWRGWVNGSNWSFCNACAMFTKAGISDDMERNVGILVG